MGTMDYIGLLPTLIDIVQDVRDRVVGYDDQIMKRFDHAIAKALKPTAKNDDWYIRNAMLHEADLIDLLVKAYDNPARIEEIIQSSYINKEEFRRLYNQFLKDKELLTVLKDEWKHYISKDTNNRVKAIQAEIGRLDKKIDKIDERAEEIKEDTGEIKKSLGDLNENVNNRFDKLNERFDDMEYRKGGDRNDDIQPLCDYLKKKLEEKREHHPSFRLMHIDEKLFPDGMVTYDTEARDSNNELKTVRKIVAESWERDETNHLMIEGEGGIGKTVTLLSLPDKFAPHYVPAIYIPLHELKGEANTIEKYIKNQVLDSKEQYDLLLKVINNPWGEGPNLLLLLDGFNEIPIELRGEISEDIEQWSERPGLQIITSSRYDIHQYVALRSSFSKIELQPLSEETVSEYLENNKIGIPENKTVIKLITIPLLLTLFIKAEAIRNDRPSRFAKFLDTKNAGLLIWNYLQCELWRFKNKKEEAKACVLAMEFIAPYIAWTMQQHSEFVLEESTFLDRIEEAYNLMKRHIDAHGQLPEHIKTTLQQSKGLPDYDDICDLLKEQLCLFIGNDGEYRLMHQQFRDVLAAMHLINLSYLLGDSLPQEWNTPIDYYVMQFVADLISEEEATRLWEQNRKIQPTLEDATRNQLRLQGLLHNNDFSHLDFSGLDLRDISLYSYRNSEAIIKLPIQQARMVKTKISKKTFSPEGHEDWVFAIAVTPDEKHIVSGSRDCTIRVWDLASCAAIGEPIEAHKKWVTAIAVTPKGDVVSGSDDGTIRVWDIDKGTEIRTIYGHKDRVTAVVVTQDGKWIVSGSVDSTIRVWDMETGAAIGKPLKGHKSRVNSIAVTSDRKLIVSGSADSTIRVWDMENGGAIKKLIKGHDGWVTAVAVTPDGSRIVSGSVDLTIRVWDMKTGEAILPPIEGHQYSVSAIAVILDRKLIVSGSWDCTIRVWNLETGAAMLPSIKGHQNSVTTIAVTPDKNRIVSGSWDRTIRVWDLATGAAIVKTIEEGHKKLIRSVAVTADEKYIVSSSGDCIIRVWDLETGTAIGKLLEGHEGRVTAVAVTPDGKHIVSGSEDGTIHVWDMETGEAIKKPIEAHKKWVTAIAVTPKGDVVSGSDDGTIRVWDIDKGTEIRTIYGHYGRVTAVAVTPDGKRIVSESWGTIRIWDLKSGKAIVKPIEGRYYNSVNAVAVTLDGKRIIVRSWDYFIRVWDLATGVAIENNTDGYKLWENAVVLITNRERIVYDDDIISITDTETRKVKKIKVHPLSFVGLDFSQVDISDADLKETLRQNGAKV